MAETVDVRATLTVTVRDEVKSTETVCVEVLLALSEAVKVVSRVSDDVTKLDSVTVRVGVALESVTGLVTLTDVSGLAVVVRVDLGDTVFDGLLVKLTLTDDVNDRSELRVSVCVLDAVLVFGIDVEELEVTDSLCDTVNDAIREGVRLVVAVTGYV